MRQLKARYLHRKWNSSPIATLLFILAAMAILYACTRLLLNVARNALQDDANRPPSEAAATLSPSDAPDASALRVSAIRTPSPVTPTPMPTLPVDDTPAPVATPVPHTPTPSPTLPPARTAAPMTGECADLLLIGMDEASSPDWIAIARIRGNACKILSIPRNTLAGTSRRLSSAGSSATCARLLANVWPVTYPQTIVVKLSGLTAFVDQFNGVEIDGRSLNGEATLAYLENGPSDELLRITRQQSFMRAYLRRLQSVSMLSLLSSRLTLEPYIESKLGVVEAFTLFELIRRIDADALTFQTLPVDSCQLDGVRCYTPDVSLISDMLPDWAS